MPVDPSISLAVTGAGGATPPPNPLDTISKFADVQNKINETRLFNQTFAARQAAGQIFATSPDMATATDRISRDPSVSAFAPELVNLARQNQLVMTELQGKQQEQARSGFEGFVKALPQIYNHPENWGPMVNAQMDLLPPAIRAQVAPSLEMIRKGLTDGLPTDPAAALDMYHSRLNGMMVAAGITPDLIHQVAGTPGTLNTGPATVGTMQTPAGEPGAGGLTTANGGVGMHVGPTITDIPNTAGGTTRAVVGEGGGGVRSLGQTPTTVQAGENVASATTAADIVKEVNHSTSVLPIRINTLDKLEGAMKEFQAGGGANWRTEAGSALQGLKNLGLPVTQSMINAVGNKSLTASQFFNTQLKPMVTNMLSQDAAGQGRVMLPEVHAYLEMLSRANDPATIVRAFNQIRRGYQIAYDKAQKWQDYEASGGDPAKFNTWYAEHVNLDKLPSKTEGGLRLGPTDPASVLGGGKSQRSLDEIYGITKPKGK